MLDPIVLLLRSCVRIVLPISSENELKGREQPSTVGLGHPHRASMVTEEMFDVLQSVVFSERRLGQNPSRFSFLVDKKENPEQRPGLCKGYRRIC